MHNHNCGCNHQLEYCGHCDVVYCKKCNKEWKYNFYNYVYPWTYTQCGTTGYLSAGGTPTNTVTYAANNYATNCIHH